MEHQILYNRYLVIWFVFVSKVVGKDNEARRDLLFTTQDCRDIDPTVTYFCPVRRYCDWNYHDDDEKNSLTQVLGYSKNTWDYNNAINEDLEFTSFEEIGQDRQNALQVIGFNEDSHDCCHGHYQGYDWSDFDGIEYAGVKAAWELLGYNRTKWNNEVITEFNYYLWDELSDEQRYVLNGELCYTRELWNGKRFSLWPETAIIPGSRKMQSNQTDAPTPPLLSQSPTLPPTSDLTLQPTSDITLQPTSKPTMLPTSKPTLLPTSKPTLLPKNEPTKSPSDVKIVLPTQILSTLETSVPSLHITSTPTQQITKESSTTTETSQNLTLIPAATSIPTTLPTHRVIIESNIPSAMPSQHSTLVPTKIPTQNATGGVNSTLEPQRIIIESNIPSLMPSQHSTLVPTKISTQNATGGVNSTLESRISLKPTSIPSLQPSFAIDIAEALSCGEKVPTMTYYCPSQRYCGWDGHNSTVTSWLGNRLEYRRRTWNFYRINAVEQAEYELLTEDVLNSINEVGYDEDTHECCNNHYGTYGWTDFDLYNMSDERIAWETVGYDQNSWDNSLSIESEEFYWEDLSDDITFALTEYLCYSRELWNEVPLEIWPDDSILPGSYEMYYYDETSNDLVDEQVADSSDEQVVDSNDEQVVDSNDEQVDESIASSKTSASLTQFFLCSGVFLLLVFSLL